MIDRKEFFVERREEGDYAVRRPGSQRARSLSENFLADAERNAILSFA